MDIGYPQTVVDPGDIMDILGTETKNQIADCFRSVSGLLVLVRLYVLRIASKRITRRLLTLLGLFLVGAFRRKTQTIVVTFFKTNELTDFINFISKH